MHETILKSNSGILLEIWDYRSEITKKNCLIWLQAESIETQTRRNSNAILPF